MAARKKFNKPPFGRQELIDLMEKRGLPFPSKEEKSRARKAIASIGYYRLSGYMPIFQVGGDGANKHDFLASATLTKILELYKFDSALRHHLSAALEIIEVAFRTSICDHMCRSTKDSHWILNAANFRGIAQASHLETFKFAVLEQNKNSEFVNSYFENYDDPFLPPAWMMRECATFGAWSKLFSDLEAKDQKAVSDDWLYPEVPGKKTERIDHTILEKWMRSMVVLRNRCSHHSRVTNRVFSFSPPEASTHFSVKHLFGKVDTDLRTLMVIIAIFLKNIDPRSMWLRQLYVLFDGYSRGVDVAKATGFDASWQGDVLWSF